MRDSSFRGGTSLNLKFELTRAPFESILKTIMYAKGTLGVTHVVDGAQNLPSVSPDVEGNKVLLVTTPINLVTSLRNAKKSSEQTGRNSLRHILRCIWFVIDYPYVVDRSQKLVTVDTPTEELYLMNYVDLNIGFVLAQSVLSLQPQSSMYLKSFNDNTRPIYIFANRKDVKWRNSGNETPQGIRIINTGLSWALREGKTLFSQDELEKFGVDPSGTFIDANENTEDDPVYFKKDVRTQKNVTDGRKKTLKEGEHALGEGDDIVLMVAKLCGLELVSKDRDLQETQLQDFIQKWTKGQEPLVQLNRGGIDTREQEIFYAMYMNQQLFKYDNGFFSNLYTFNDSGDLKVPQGIKHVIPESNVDMRELRWNQPNGVPTTIAVLENGIAAIHDSERESTRTRPTRLSRNPPPLRRDAERVAETAMLKEFEQKRRKLKE